MGVGEVSVSGRLTGIDVLDAVASILEKINLVWFGLVWFYGISTFVGYLTPNPFLCK